MTSAHDEAAAGDRVLRAITDDDTFRVMVASTTETVRGVLSSQRVGGGSASSSADHFADLLTGMVLIRETMSPDHRVQGILKGMDGRGTLVADTHPDGMTRGLLQLPDDAHPFVIGHGSMLTVMRSMAQGRIHRSITRPGDGATVSQALMTYMQESEQIVSMIGIGTRWEEGAVSYAGGFVIQLLPDGSRAALMSMTERLERLPSTDELLFNLDGSAKRLLDELLYRMPYAQLDSRPVSHGCRCDRDAVVASLAAVSRDELAELVRDNEVLEISCDYCRSDYSVTRAHLHGLLEPS